MPLYWSRVSSTGPGCRSMETTQGVAWSGKAHSVRGWVSPQRRLSFSLVISSQLLVGGLPACLSRCVLASLLVKEWKRECAIWSIISASNPPYHSVSAPLFLTVQRLVLKRLIFAVKFDSRPIASLCLTSLQSCLKIDLRCMAMGSASMCCSVVGLCTTG